MRNILFFFMFALLSAGCVSTGAVYKHDYDFTKVGVVYVGDFGAANSGVTVKNAVIKQLMSKGYIIKSANTEDVDLIVSGAVSEYQPSKKYLIRQPDPNNGNIVVYNTDPVEISGSMMYDLGSAFGLENSKVMASNATVGVSVYMKDPKTDDIVWTNSYTYEGLDLSSAIDGAIRYILKSFPTKIINMKKG